MAPFIVLATDFGLEGPIPARSRLCFTGLRPAVPVIDLFADLPPGKPQPAAYLLSAYSVWFPPGTVFLAVVDPGWAGRARRSCRKPHRRYVGRTTGLFELVVRRGRPGPMFGISPLEPEPISASFHGRDLFAPAAGRLARGDAPAGQPRPGALVSHMDWPDDLCEIVYIDRFGNAMTGLRAGLLPARGRLAVAGRIDHTGAGLLRCPARRGVLVRELEWAC